MKVENINQFSLLKDKTWNLIPQQLSDFPWFTRGGGVLYLGTEVVCVKLDSNDAYASP